MRYNNSQKRNRHKNEVNIESLLVKLLNGNKINEESLAETISNAVNKTIESNIKNITFESGEKRSFNEQNKYEYDNSSSIEKLARSMTVERNKNQTNFESIGKTIISENDIDKTNKTIDLLKDLED